MAIEQITTSDFLNAFRRRSRLFLVTLLIVLGIAVAFAVLPADEYRASAEMRIDLEGPNIGVLEPVFLANYADQYVNTLERSVMTDENLEKWLEASDAYQYEDDDVDQGELLERLLDDILIEMVFTTVIEERDGKEVDLITGFTTTFVGRDPMSAKIVANSVAEAFLVEDKATRIARASTASSFLMEQINSQREEIVAIEAQIADFKEEHAGKLPDMAVLNMTALERTDRELGSVQREIRILQQDKYFREAQLEDIKQSVGGEVEQLAVLETEYHRAIAVYGPDHPDVMRIQRQVAALTTGKNAVGSSELGRLETELAVAEERYSEEHPDVISLKRRISELQAGDPFQRDPTAENPLYLQLRAQINAIDTNLQGLRVRAGELRDNQADLQNNMASMPQVERQYRALERKLQTTSLAFEGLRERFAQAQQTESYESGERGARLVQVSAAKAPNRPTGPPRLAIIIVGLFLATTFAGFAAFIAEFSDDTIRGSKDILTVMQTPAIAMIPIAQNSVSLSDRRRQMRILSMGVLILVALIVMTVFKLGV